MSDAIQFEVPLRAVRAAAAFISTDETRYVINGVHFCEVNGQNIVVATDGMQMLILHIDESLACWPQGMKVTLKPDVILTMGEKFGLPSDNLWITIQDAKTVMCEAMIEGSPSKQWKAAKQWKAEVERTDWVGLYPDWWHCVPEEEPAEKRKQSAVCLDAARLERIEKAFGIYCRRSGGVMVHMPCDIDVGPIVVTNGYKNIVAILMPMRREKSDEMLPQFVKQAVTWKESSKGKGAGV